MTTSTTAADLFDWQEMARRIGRTPDWVRRNTKRLPHHRLGNRVMFSDECVRLFMAQTLVNPGARTAGSRARDKATR